CYSGGDRKIPCLRKVIYGLKHSPQAWLEKFSQVILSLAFRRSDADHSVFVRNTSAGIVLSERKYAQDMLAGPGLLGTTPVDTPMEPNPDEEASGGLHAIFIPRNYEEAFGHAIRCHAMQEKMDALLARGT
ncbi:hypothetical protein AKJ16_DCAP00890, partial [Drosera capensis]